MLERMIQNWRDRLALLGTDDEPARQSGAIPYTLLDGRVVFLLVTSRRSGRWIFPKGEPIEGLTPWETASVEAREEAGVEGDIDRTPIGVYRTMKTVAIRRKVIEVELFPLRVTRQLEQWQDQESRHRHWAILPEAKRLLSDKRLGELAARLSERLLREAQPTNQAISR